MGSRIRTPHKIEAPKAKLFWAEGKRETSSSKRGVVNKGLSRVSAPEIRQMEKNSEF